MGHRYAEIAFTQTVKRLQAEDGSRAAYARLEADAEPANHLFGPVETAFVQARDSLYMATVGETGWPYLQHRGGPAGFVRVLDAGTLGFADFRGNRQHISAGNLQGDPRVSLFFMDYPNRRRLKVLGRAETVDPADTALLDALALPDYRARVERGLLIRIEAFDWNCPQHITPRFSPAEVEGLVAPLQARIAELEAELARLWAPQA